jgi:hypothetical protein
MNSVLAAWNDADADTARAAMIACCGAHRWADAMVALRPLKSVMELSDAADRIWGTMTEEDWLEAFACHPRIGAIGGLVDAGASLNRKRRRESACRPCRRQRAL